MKQKKLTLDRAWEMCVEMWDWIAGMIKREPELENSIDFLKIVYIALNFPDMVGELHNNCPFCQYGLESMTFEKTCCDSCPGRLVSKRFACMDSSYQYDKFPKKFHKKLLSLYARYLKQKQGCSKQKNRKNKKLN